MVKGVVRRAAEVYFNLSIDVESLATQGENCSEYSVWRLKRANPVVLVPRRNGKKEAEIKRNLFAYLI
jgi:hypothetical protein